MIITSDFRQNILVVRIIGNLDIFSRDECRKTVTELTDSHNTKKVLLEISKMKRIDSAGVGCLAELVNSLRSAGGDLRVAGEFSKHVWDTFKMCGLDRVLKIYPDEDTGIEEWSRE